MDANTPVDDAADAAASAVWDQVLKDGHGSLVRARHVFRYLPSSPRCKLCNNPFGGMGGRVLRIAGFRQSRKNPNLCTRCCDSLPAGGAEVDIAVLFADIRGSTGLGEQTVATDFAALLNRFYATATETLLRHDAVIDKLIGDEVMALFIPGLAGPDYRRKAALAALDLAAAFDDMPVGVAANAGIAFVGNVGSGTVLDFTALGDAVNIGARLQSHASSGEVVLASDLYALVAADHPGARSELVEVRGRDEPVNVDVVTT